MIMNGTGTPISHPASSTLFLLKESASAPETRFEHAFTTPKETMNEKMAVVRTSTNSSEPTSGTTVRSKPTIPPTKALTSTRRANCPRFSRRPSRTAGAGGLVTEAA
jgi:hypothetical protein